MIETAPLGGSKLGNGGNPDQFLHNLLVGVVAIAAGGAPQSPLMDWGVAFKNQDTPALDEMTFLP